MQELITKVSPIFIIFVVGYVLKRINFLVQDHADLFLKLVMYLALPALIVPSFAGIPLSAELVVLPFVSVVTMFFTLIVAFIVATLLSLPKQTKGTFVLASSIMNLGLALSFYQAAFGQEVIAYFLLLMLGHDIVLFTLLYYLACFYGSTDHVFSHHKAVKKLFLLPPLWAVAVGLLLNVTKTQIPYFILPSLNIVGSMFTPLLMLALGVVFSVPERLSLKLCFPLVIRSGCGILIGLLLSELFSLEGVVRAAVVLGSAAPVGFNTLVFSTIENLDKKLAAQIVSSALILGGFMLPLLLYFLS